MRYLTVNADYLGTGVSDDFEGPVTLVALGIDSALGHQIAQWVDDYQPVIADSRSVPSEVIQELDRRGLELARAVQTALGDEAKVRYFSEARAEHTLL